VSVVVPTKDRPDYLGVTLRSLRDQDLAEPYELIVVDDGEDPGTPAAAHDAGARLLRPRGGRGPNTARNTGIADAGADLIALVDDDVHAPAGWLRALVEGAARHPEADAFGGPIRARFEGPAPRSCGREEPPITSLDLGPEDRDAELVWSANMLLRRAAWERVGPLDERFSTGGDEEEWLRRLRAAGGRVVYLAAAALDHRRAGDDARLRSLMRSAYHRGRNMRAYDGMRGSAPGLARELRVLAGCGWHTVRRGCPQGLIAGAHSGGRLAEALRPRLEAAQPPALDSSGPGPDPSEFLSGTLGEPGGRAGRLARRLADRALDAQLARAGGRLDELAAAAPERDVLVLSVYRGDGGLLPKAVAELRATRHRVRFALGSMDETAPALAAETTATGLSGGKFENLNALMPFEPAGVVSDWTLVLDDDVELPPRFLDRMIGLAEHYDLALAQPAQSLASHAAWAVARRRRGSLLRESRFVEIGPVTLFRRDALAELAPFPPLRFGWGLDVHWAALAQERGWRLGIADALPVRHERAGVARAYDSTAAIAEARGFLAERPFLDSGAVQETIRTHPLR
jgi:GT2 family glycosyltransferase